VRTPRLISGFKNSQRIRVIVDGVGFFTTVNGTQDICTSHHRMAVQLALMNLSHDIDMAQRQRRPERPTGFGFNYIDTDKGRTVPVQVDLV